MTAFLLIESPFHDLDNLSDPPVPCHGPGGLHAPDTIGLGVVGQRRFDLLDELLGPARGPHEPRKSVDFWCWHRDNRFAGGQIFPKLERRGVYDLAGQAIRNDRDVERLRPVREASVWLRSDESNVRE